MSVAIHTSDTCYQCFMVTHAVSQIQDFDDVVVLIHIVLYLLPVSAVCTTGS